LDSNQDGVIDAQDTDFSALFAWLDHNQDGFSQADELVDLATLGIVSINLDADKVSEMNNGNWVGLLSSYQTQDGQNHAIADVWLRTETAATPPPDSVATTANLDSGVSGDPMQLLGLSETTPNTLF